MRILELCLDSTFTHMQEPVYLQVHPEKKGKP